VFVIHTDDSVVVIRPAHTPALANSFVKDGTTAEEDDDPDTHLRPFKTFHRCRFSDHQAMLLSCRLVFVCHSQCT
jgi:hypothetical protein